MNTLLHTSIYKPPLSNLFSFNPSIIRLNPRFRAKNFKVNNASSSNELDTKAIYDESKQESIEVSNKSSVGATEIEKDLKKVT